MQLDEKVGLIRLSSSKKYADYFRSLIIMLNTMMSDLRLDSRMHEWPDV